MQAILNLVFAAAALILGFVRLAITPIKPGATTIPAQVAGQAGALPDVGGLITTLTALSNNGAPAFGNFSLTRISAPVAARTYTGAEMVGGFIRREQTAAYTDCTDTATNIVNAIPGAMNGQSFAFLLANCGPGTATLAAGTGVTIAGSATISGLSARLYLGAVTGSAAVTLTNFFSFNSGGGTQFL
jgi:hypothetical protein